jgi:hypothetical protein
MSSAFIIIEPVLSSIIVISLIAPIVGGSLTAITVTTNDVLSDTEFSDSTSFVVTVIAVNDPPTIGAINDITIIEDNTGSIIINAEDIDGDDLEYEITSGEPYFDFVIEADTITISPHLNWFGETSLTVSASDGQESVDTGLSITVTPVNDAPTIEAIDGVNMDFDGSIDIVLSSDDVDGDDLIYSFHLDNYDVSLGIEEDTLTINATPDFNGDVPITMFVSDTELMDSTSFTVTVNAVNDVLSINSVSETNIVIGTSPLKSGVAFMVSVSSSMPSDTS